MKKMLFVLVALLIASPAMAVVNITASAVVDDTNAVITISYEATEGEAIRAIAIDATLDGTATITDVNCVNGDFTIYPGSISIAGDGSISDAGSCLCDDSYAGTLDGVTGATIEMGSLYEIGVESPPAASGDVVEISITGNDDVNVCVLENAIRGGVVLEDPDVTPTVNVECITVSLAPSAIPTCWDASECAGQMFGDADCSGAVNLGDLLRLKAAFGQSAPWSGNNCCADFNQSGAVNLGDLLVLKANFGSTGYATTGNQTCP